MSSYYGVIFPEFWTGITGRELRRHGKDAQLLGLYLATNRHANMLGLYRLLIDDIRHETGLGAKAIARGFDAAARTEFARFDAATSHVWVRSMARFRLGLKAGEALAQDDNRSKATNRLYQAIDPNPFLGEFYEANHRILRLTRRRDSIGLVVDLPSDHQMSPLPSPLGAPWKPVNRIRDQVQDQVKNASLRAAVPRRVITKLAMTVLDAHPGESFPDLKEAAKQACAAHRLPYDPEAVGSALEQALARKARAS